MSRRLALTIVFLLAACAPVSTPDMAVPSASTTALTARIVQIDTSSEPTMRLFVSLRDQADGALTNFKIGNFLVIEDSKPVPALSSGLVNEGLSAVLVIDRSGSMFGSVVGSGGVSGKDASEAAAIDFVNALPTNTSIALIEFDDEVKLSVPFTTDKAKVTSAISAGALGGTTAIYDAIKSASDLFSGMAGRKLLLALTDGVDNASEIDVDALIQAVNQQGISANTVTLNTGVDLSGGPMQRIATETGGTYFNSTTGADLTPAFLDAIEVFESLMFVKYRQRAEGVVRLAVSYGSLTAEASKSLPEEKSEEEGGAASATTSARSVDSR
jgi:hypothetical protein